MDELEKFATEAHDFVLKKAKAEGKYDEMLANRAALKSIPDSEELGLLQIGKDFLSIVGAAKDMEIDPLKAGQFYLKKLQQAQAASQN